MCFRFVARALFLSGASLALFGVAMAQITASGGGYRFRYKFTPGSLVKYKNDTSVSISSGSQPMTISMPFSVKTKSVSNGVATLDYTMQMPSVGQGSGGPQTVTMKMDTLGKPVGDVAVPSSSMVVYPSGPIKVGGSWGGTVMTGAGQMPMKLNAKYVFQGMKTIGGKQLAQVKVTATANGTGAQKMSISANGTAYLNPADGMLQSMDLSMKLTIQMEGGKPIVSNTSTKIAREG